MKKQLFSILLLAICALGVRAQDDSLYIVKNGDIVGRYSILNDIDSIIFSLPGTPQLQKYTDTQDGTVYKMLTIPGTIKIWMSENLKYLPSVAGTTTSSVNDPYYYVNGYSGTDVAAAKVHQNYLTYGVLYNWTAAMNGGAASTANPSGVQGACPTGWHLPSVAEWNQLLTALGGAAVAEGKLKETGTLHWNSPDGNVGATNESRFRALPGGYFVALNGFVNTKHSGYWWTTGSSGTNATAMIIYASDDKVDTLSTMTKNMAASARCVKD